MRAVFTVDIPAVSVDKYPTDDEFLSRIRQFGWEDRCVTSLPHEEKLRHYKTSAQELWGLMPEIAAEEKDYLIFFGFVQDNQTKFIITRRIDGQATFRLIHPELGKLQASTYNMVKKLASSTANIDAMKISGKSISIYERGHDHIIIKGRVISSALREAMSIDKKNVFLSVLPGILALISLIAVVYVNSGTNRVLGGTVERFSTSMLTTTIVAAIGFFQTYWNLRFHKLIDWKVAEGDGDTL